MYIVIMQILDITHMYMGMKVIIVKILCVVVMRKGFMLGIKIYKEYS